MAFNPLDENLDVAWLLANGWTVNGNLAYRHILHEMNHSPNKQVPSLERIEQIMMQYDAANQAHKIKEALQDLIELKQIFQSMK